MHGQGPPALHPQSPGKCGMQNQCPPPIPTPTAVDQYWFIQRPVCCVYVAPRYVAPPMARCVGVRNRVQVMAPPSPKLEAFYTLRSRQPTQVSTLQYIQLQYTAYQTLGRSAIFTRHVCDQ